MVVQNDELKLVGGRAAGSTVLPWFDPVVVEIVVDVDVLDDVDDAAMSPIPQTLARLPRNVYLPYR